MSSRFAFDIQSEDHRRELPGRIIIGRQETETTGHVLLKLLGFVLFHRARLQIEPRLHDDNIPFTPSLVQLDYSLQPVLWVECGEVAVAKLDKLAVKAPAAEIWILKRSPGDAELLLHEMDRHELRRNRYRVLAFDPEMFDEALRSLSQRNQVFWLRGEFEPPALQFDFNGLWFDGEFRVMRF